MGAEDRATEVEKIIAAVKDEAWRQPLGATNAERIVEALTRAGYMIVSKGDEGTRITYEDRHTPVTNFKWPRF